MKKLIVITALLLTSLLSNNVYANWQPTFVDNFEGSTLNEFKWSNSRSNLPRRSSYYSPEAIRVSNGKLNLLALNKPQSDRSYTTGTVTTQGVFAQKYGYFEMRAKLPAGKGFWSAFWLLPDTGKWTSEIDIAEFFGGDKPDTVYSAFHHSGRLQNENSATSQTFKDLSKGFNTYAVKWTTEKIDYIFNGVVIHSVTDAEAVSKADSKMSIILNLATATETLGFVKPVNENTVFPNRFQVDYVRVYKETPNGQYASIPAANIPVADTAVSLDSADGTAVNVKRIGSEPDRFVDTTQPITGKIAVTALGNNIKSKVLVSLFRVENFQSDGRYYNNPLPEKTIVRKFTFSSAGSTEIIDYDFSDVTVHPGVYAIDILVKDLVSGNKKQLSGHRIVQFVNSNIHTAKYFEGFIESINPAFNAITNRISVNANIQIVQSLLVSNATMTFSIIDESGATIGNPVAKQIGTDEVLVGLLNKIFPNLMTEQLDTAQSYSMKLSIADAGNNPVFEKIEPIIGTKPPVKPPVVTDIDVSQKYWLPTFVENFNGTELNTNNWIPGGRATLPRRLNYYDRDAVEVSNGTLKLKMLNKPQSDRPYSTGAITTQGLFAQKHGYFEMRARIPDGNGFWGAFWLFPKEGRWTNEIDISEFLGDKPNSVLFANHFGNRLRNGNTREIKAAISDLSNTFNNYAVEWNDDHIKYFLNGKLMHTISRSGGDLLINPEDETEMYLILNLALASQHTGFITNVDASTDLNETLEVDYVRVYKEVPEGTGGVLGIPDATEVVNNITSVAYDNTAVEVTRVFNNSDSGDVMRQPGQISGTLKLTPHSSVNETKVIVFLAKVSGFDQNNGKYSIEQPIAVINKTVQFTGNNPVSLDYVFDKLINSTGVYSVDVLIKDNTTVGNNKKALTSHRIVQYVDSTSEPIFFDAFFKNITAHYQSSSVAVRGVIEIQQALLVDGVNISYTIRDNETGGIILDDTASNSILGFQTLLGKHDIGREWTLPSLDTSKSYSVFIRVTDSRRSKTFSITVPITGAATTPVTPPPVSGKVELNTIGVIQNAGGLEIVADMNVPNNVSTINAIFKFRDLTTGAIVEKIISEGFSGTVSKTGSALVVGKDYEVITFLFSNGWVQKDVFDKRIVTVR
ncbi:MAG: glycoside hydrolase family 16 protein [Gammaproteobacteria bacterium]